MTSLRRFTAHDLLSFNNVNLDYFTETVRGQLPARLSCCHSCLLGGCASVVSTQLACLVRPCPARSTTCPST